jgi:hypothetical protein
VHTLVVGGSGMLDGVCRGLAERGHDVSVVARGSERLEALRSERITPVQVDYGDLTAFEAALQAAIDERGSIGFAVCWIRSWQPDSLRLVAGLLREGTALYHVLGTSGSPAAELEGVDYRVVRLGRGTTGLRPPGRRPLASSAADRAGRWLTNDEISAGVLEAIDRESAEFLVCEP